MSSASEIQPLNNTIRGRSGQWGVITITLVLVACTRALWILGTGSQLPPMEFVILGSLAVLFGVLANDQRRGMLRLTSSSLDIGHGKRVQRLPFTDIHALSLRVSGGRYVDCQLICWNREGAEVAHLSLQPFRRTALREFMIRIHQAYPSIQMDRELAHFLQLERTLFP